MKKVFGALYTAVFMMGAYALSTQAQSGTETRTEASTACGSCRYLHHRTPKAVAGRVRKFPKKGHK